MDDAAPGLTALQRFARARKGNRVRTRGPAGQGGATLTTGPLGGEGSSFEASGAVRAARVRCQIAYRRRAREAGTLLAAGRSLKETLWFCLSSTRMPQINSERMVGCSETMLARPSCLLQIDADKSASHHLSQSEIASDNPCSRQLSGQGSFPLAITARQSGTTR